MSFPVHILKGTALPDASTKQATCDDIAHEFESWPDVEAVFETVADLAAHESQDRDDDGESA